MNLPATLQENIWIIAKQDKPISQLDNKELNDRLIEVLLKSQAMFGYVNSDEKAKDAFRFLKETIFKDLRYDKKHATLTMAEIELFISKGIKGEYPSPKNGLNSLNVQNIHFWILQGREDKSRIEALRAKENALIERIGQPNKELIEAELKASLMRLFEFLYNGGDLNQSYKNYPIFAFYDMMLAKYGIEVTRDGKTGRTLIPSKEDKLKVDAEAIAEFQDYITKSFKKQADYSDIQDFCELMDSKVRRANAIKKHHVLYALRELIRKNEPLEL